ncbi:Peptidoglycan/LPS O-acetylase OafA/YrhL, contains acyltransferase and SGNH-hydrolase domains [Nonomuraea maritima]|uniref:Peptidoglycan/LPS O-acetylase OafA/YrhL, contains acyltransferase and SGNH-hydrolase domains n=1 Tax=Nonomuraea maritima TaxID=683260 RepID=A0A1G9IX14_9ACTN|nr:Peptidoglycan/LPS O-acetylase OafA/YrhL, contains acyltransferase and SGNH-hydrolase domains [Nonomuraea maritima]
MPPPKTGWILRVRTPARPQLATLPRQDRLYEIDLLRIIAAVAVMVYHYGFADYAGGLTKEQYAGLDVVVRYGYLGVDLFFLISGFVVLLSAFGRTPRQFVTSRVTRLYPAYWVAVTFTALTLVLLSQGQFTVTPLQFAANATMANSLVDQPNIDVVYWTLWSELRFYVLVFALVCFGVTKNRVLWALWTWLGITFLLHASVLPGAAQNLLSLVFQPDWAQYFIAGMALCLVYRFGPSLQPVLIFLISYGYAVVVALDFADDVAARYQTTINLIVVLALVAAAFAVMMYVALRLTGRFARPWFAALGALTYPLYLVHDRVGVVLFNRLDTVLNPWVVLGLVVALMVGLAWAAHRYVERPFAPVLKRAVTRVLSAKPAST